MRLLMYVIESYLKATKELSCLQTKFIVFRILGLSSNTLKLSQEDDMNVVAAVAVWPIKRTRKL